VHPHDGGKVGRGKSVTPAEHGERNLPGRGLAFQPTLLDPQNQGGFFGRVYGWYGLAVSVVVSRVPRDRLASSAPVSLEGASLLSSLTTILTS
jgi:hypothetical protein